MSAPKSEQLVRESRPGDCWTVTDADRRHVGLIECAGVGRFGAFGPTGDYRGVFASVDDAARALSAMEARP
jgi:hypothetical protein